jgi:hypothetical protein
MLLVGGMAQGPDEDVIAIRQKLFFFFSNLAIFINFTTKIVRYD